MSKKELLANKRLFASILNNPSLIKEILLDGASSSTNSSNTNRRGKAAPRKEYSKYFRNEPRLAQGFRELIKKLHLDGWLIVAPFPILVYTLSYSVYSTMVMVGSVFFGYLFIWLVWRVGWSLREQEDSVSLTFFMTIPGLRYLWNHCKHHLFGTPLHPRRRFASFLGGIGFRRCGRDAAGDFLEETGFLNASSSSSITTASHQNKKKKGKATKFNERIPHGQRKLSTPNLQTNATLNSRSQKTSAAAAATTALDSSRHRVKPAPKIGGDDDHFSNEKALGFETEFTKSQNHRNDPVPEASQSRNTHSSYQKNFRQAYGPLASIPEYAQRKSSEIRSPPPNPSYNHHGEEESSPRSLSPPPAHKRNEDREAVYPRKPYTRQDRKEWIDSIVRSPLPVFEKPSSFASYNSKYQSGLPPTLRRSNGDALESSSLTTNGLPIPASPTPRIGTSNRNDTLFKRRSENAVDDDDANLNSPPGLDHFSSSAINYDDARFRHNHMSSNRSNSNEAIQKVESAAEMPWKWFINEEVSFGNRAPTITKRFSTPTTDSFFERRKSGKQSLSLGIFDDIFPQEH